MFKGRTAEGVGVYYERGTGEGLGHQSLEETEYIVAQNLDVFD